MQKRQLHTIIQISIIAIGIFLVLSLITHVAELSDALRFDRDFKTGGTLVFSTVISLITHSTSGTFIATALYSIIFALNIHLLIRYYKKHGSLLRSTSSAGAVGAVIGMLGIGCAACGTLALTAALSLIGLGSLLVLLPFNGQEIYYLGIVILIFSSLKLKRMIDKPLVC